MPGTVVHWYGTKPYQTAQAYSRLFDCFGNDELRSKTTDGDVTHESSRVTSRVDQDLWRRLAMIDCRDAVPQPVDASPVRSPQTVHSKIAHLVAGKKSSRNRHA